MKSSIVGLLAETFVHPGSGQNEGAIDLPVAREAATDYPYIAGSSFKGALKDHARRSWLAPSDNGHESISPEVQHVFGIQENAGDLLVSDVRLLLLPVRSLNGSYKWVSCPYLLERLKRDKERAGIATSFTIPAEIDDQHVLTAGTGHIFLEELCFQASPLPNDLVPALQPLAAHDSTKNRMGSQLAIISDTQFSWYARYGLSVQARNVLDEDKKSKNLWYEETLPPDTLMYAVLSERRAGTMDKLKGLFSEQPYIQVGGNETVGQGWFISTWQEARRD